MVKQRTITVRGCDKEGNEVMSEIKIVPFSSLFSTILAMKMRQINYWILEIGPYKLFIANGSYNISEMKITPDAFMSYSALTILLGGNK